MEGVKKEKKRKENPSKEEDWDKLWTGWLY